MIYTLHDQHGRILATISCSPDEVEANAAANGATGCIEGDFSFGDHYIDEGVAIPMPPRPSADHVFDYATKAWADPRTIDELREAAWTRIKAAREAALFAPLETPFGVFDANERGQQNIKDTVQLQQALSQLGMPADIEFTLADNTVVVLPPPTMTQVGLLLGARVQSVYSRSRVLRAAIEAASTKAELDAITW